MLMRVSNVEAFRRWRNDESQSLEDFIRYITVDEPSEKMLAGTALHKALELAVPGDFGEMEANGHRFIFEADCSIALQPIRELRGYKTYGGLTVTGQVDAMDGLVIYDHKTTGRFDPDRYMEGCQWKYYLSIFGAQVFRWNVFEMREVEPMTYLVHKSHVMEQCRYPAMESDCLGLAGELEQFARIHMPEREHYQLDAAA